MMKNLIFVVFLCLGFSVDARFKESMTNKLQAEGGGADSSMPADVTWSETKVEVATLDALKQAIAAQAGSLAEGHGVKVSWTAANGVFDGLKDKKIYIWKHGQDGFQINVKGVTNNINFQHFTLGDKNVVSLSQIYAIAGFNMADLKTLALMYAEAFINIPCTALDYIILTDACAMNDLDGASCTMYYSIKRGKPAYGYGFSDSTGELFTAYSGPLAKNPTTTVRADVGATIQSLNALMALPMNKVKDEEGFSLCESSSEKLVSAAIGDIGLGTKSFFSCLFREGNKLFKGKYKKEQTFKCTNPQ